MRNIWVAVVGVFALTLFVGSSFATAPIAQDVPDFRLMTGSGAVTDFDLNEYVTDYDDDSASLDWTIQGTSGFDSVPTTDIDSSNLLDIGGSSSPDQGVITFRVADASEYAEDTSVVKYASLMVVGPGLTEDNNLNPEDTFPRSWVLEADAVITTTTVLDLINPSSAASSASLSVSIASMNGVCLAGDGDDTATSYGGLDASLSGAGELVLSGPAGGLTAAYRVGVKAKMSGGGLAGAEDNWDGAEVLVSSARFPARDFECTATRLDNFDNFEVGTAGALKTTRADMNALSEADNPHWYKLTGTGTATIIDGSSLSAPAWASSGQVLEMEAASAADSVMVVSEWFTDIEPGETLTFSANIATSAAVETQVADFVIFIGNFHMSSNYEGFLLQEGTSTGTAELPVGDDWRNVKVTFTADTVGAAVADGSDPDVNFYEKGYQAVMNLTGSGATAFPFSVYVDNVRIYRDEKDIDKALGNTVAAVKSTGGGLFDGTFEGGTDLAGVGWVEHGALNQGTVAINTSGLNNMFTHDGTNALEMYMSSTSGRTATLTEFVYAKTELDASGEGSLNYEGAGIYAMTAWFKTNSPDVKSLPGVMVGVTDPKWKNVPFADVGHAGAPLGDAGWKQTYVASARQAATKLWPFAIVRADYSATQSNWTKVYWGSYATLADSPGYEGDAHVYFDDVQIHKIMDEAVYFDRSVFPATD